MAIRDYDGNVKCEGCVIDTYEHNGYDDSDFYAICINPQEGTIEHIEYNTTRCGGGGSATIDVTEDNYKMFLHNSKMRDLKSAIKSDRNHARVVGKGKQVIVNRGRKVPLGIVGTIFWEKEVNYDPYHRIYGEEMRIGIKDGEGNVYWTYAKNVDVYDPHQYEKPVSQLIKELKQARSKSYVGCCKTFAWNK